MSTEPDAVLRFSNVRYGVTVKASREDKARTGHASETKTILQAVSGSAYSGEMFAILGSSGSGKTTLLDCLAMRKSTGTLTGDITLNGHPIVPELFKFMTAYVMQDDILEGALTTRESLVFAAKLRMPHSSADAIQKQVESLIAEMALERAVDTRVGTELERGISGGEKKRLAIALQLLADPLILFLDEPTTGLVSDVLLELGRHTTH
jgi:ABC-type multidrug transport system ATPase subunit